MDNILNFKLTSGPHGDACSNYDVTSNCAKTVKEFIEQVLIQQDDEWGTFRINQSINEVYIEDETGNLVKLKPIKIEYKYGKLLNEIPEDLMNSEIQYPIKANGGWSLMNYMIRTTDFKY